MLVYAFVGLLLIVTISGNKRVSFEEFLPIFLSGQQKKDSGSMEDFIEGLRVFDKDGNGFINSAELRHVLTSLGKFLVSPSIILPLL
jgi:myosin light chain 6